MAMNILPISQESLDCLLLVHAKFLLEEKDSETIDAHIFSPEVRHGSILSSIRGKLIGAGILGYAQTSDLEIEWRSNDCLTQCGYFKPDDASIAEQLALELREKLEDALRVDSRVNFELLKKQQSRKSRDLEMKSKIKDPPYKKPDDHIPF